LYTKYMNPNLVNYFDKIEWIVSEKGWNLSHLAIMSREYSKLLLIVNIEKYWIKLWDIISINNDKEKLLKLWSEI
jgi:phosphoenolpyruvate synthase/pyruvate phosphate dikinase